MTDANIFQIFGLTYLAIGLGLLVSPRFYREMLTKMINDEAVLFLTGIIVFTLGALLAVFHNNWKLGWPLIITVFGWLALLKGLMMIVIPGLSVRLYKLVDLSEKQLLVYGAVVMALGIIFASLGYFVL